jgi:hypothetical protein
MDLQEYDFENATGRPTGRQTNITGAPGQIVKGQPLSAMVPNSGAPTIVGNRNFVIKVDTGATTNTLSHTVQLFGSGFNVTDIIQSEVDSTLIPGFSTRNNEVRNSAGTAVAQLYSTGAILVDGVTAIANQVYFDQNGSMVYNYNVGSGDNIFVRVTQGALSYKSLLQWLLNNQIHIYKLRMTHNNANTTGVQLNIIEKNVWGETATKILTGSLFPNPQNFNPLIYDIATDISLKNNMAITFPLVAGAGNGIEFTWQSDYQTGYTI